MRDPAAARVLEIGDHYYFKMVYPQRTTLLWTGRKAPRLLRSSEYIDCTPWQFFKAMRDAARGRYDVVVTYASLKPGWHWRNWLRSFAHTPWRPWRATSRLFGVSLLRFARLRVPLVAMDMVDNFTIGRHCFFLLDKAQLYFKRELPVDNWQVLHGSAHPNLPTLRIRRNRRWQTRLERLRPIGIGTGEITLDLGGRDFPEKTTDIFFAGAVEANSTVRSSGLAELKALAAHGVKVDLPEQRLPQAEFHRRMASAWLTWSPSGLGWQCHRHYEACQCLAVPVINWPTVVRHAPLQDGVHAFYYVPEPGELTRTVIAALADKERLKHMAIAARAHALAHHTFRAICDEVLKGVLVEMA